MLTMDEMKAFLPGAEADFQLAGQDAPLFSTSGAEKYDEPGKAAPTFIGGKRPVGVYRVFGSWTAGCGEYEKAVRPFNVENGAATENRRANSL